MSNGQPLRTGELIVQSDLAKCMQYMIDEEAAAAGQGREAALEAARSAFYKGDIAKTITDYHAANGGLLTMEDMAGIRLRLRGARKTQLYGIWRPNRRLYMRSLVPRPGLARNDVDH